MPPQICAFARIPSDFDNSLDFAWSRLLRDQEDGGSNPLAPANPFVVRPGHMGDSSYFVLEQQFMERELLVQGQELEN
jgi:hypothetical protein